MTLFLVELGTRDGLKMRLKQQKAAWRAAIIRIYLYSLNTTTEEPYPEYQ